MPSHNGPISHTLTFNNTLPNNTWSQSTQEIPTMKNIAISATHITKNSSARQQKRKGNVHHYRHTTPACSVDTTCTHNLRRSIKLIIVKYNISCYPGSILQPEVGVTLISAMAFNKSGSIFKHRLTSSSIDVFIKVRIAVALDR